MIVTFPGLQPVSTDSFEFIYTLAWLKERTKFDRYDIAQMSTQTGVLLNYDLQIVKGTQTVGIDPVLAYYNPTVALGNLQREFGLPVTGEQFVSPAPPPPVTPPAPAPTVLVGNAITGTANGYYPVPNDNSGDGTQYSDERGTFVKSVTVTPFGKSVIWYKV